MIGNAKLAPRKGMIEIEHNGMRVYKNASTGKIEERAKPKEQEKMSAAEKRG